MRTDTTPEAEKAIQAVLDWLTIRGNEEVEYSAAWLSSLQADADHSSLLTRLLEGKETLEHKPPLYMSYPWYSLIENGFEVLNAQFCHHHKVNDGGLVKGHYWHLGQQVWWVTGQDGETFFLKHHYGWTAQLDPADAEVLHLTDGEWKPMKVPGYRLTITGWKKPE